MRSSLLEQSKTLRSSLFRVTNALSARGATRFEKHVVHTIKMPLRYHNQIVKDLSASYLSQLAKTQILAGLPTPVNSSQRILEKLFFRVLLSLCSLFSKTPFSSLPIRGVGPCRVSCVWIISAGRWLTTHLKKNLLGISFRAVSD